jgi:hypothetical protein
VDPLDHQHLVVELDLAYGVAAETTVSGGDVTRLERTPERAGQSTGGRRHHVVEGGGVRLEGSVGGAVMGGDSPVNPEGDRALLGGEVGVAQRSPSSFDIDHRPIDDLSHDASSL